MKVRNCMCPECGTSGWAFHAKGDWDGSEDGYIELGLLLCFTCMRVLSVAGLDYSGEDVKFDALREAAELKFLESGQAPVVQVSESAPE